jgi:hypothetical protein
MPHAARFEHLTICLQKHGKQSARSVRLVLLPVLLSCFGTTMAAIGPNRSLRQNT